MMHRVVVTGLGVVAPNGIGIDAFLDAIKRGKSGITYHPCLRELNFSCCIGGIPQVTEAIKSMYFSPLQLRGFNSSGIMYGCIAGIDAWKDSGLSIDESNQPDYDSGTIFGAGSSGVDKFREAVYLLDQKQERRLGSTAVSQIMVSGISAYLGGMLGLGNQVTTNSSACATGVEALLLGFERIKYGQAKRMLVGSCCDDGPYIWGGFDAMRVMTYKYNNEPEKGSRPMSATASGFVPAGGAGGMVLESLESAESRGANIYAEVLGGVMNAGGQRNMGSMTAPNPDAVQACITGALQNAGVSTSEVDVINGHLTATSKDSLEVQNWAKALGRSGQDSLKSMVGHCLAAAGSIECISTILQLKEQFMFPNLNCEDVHPEILDAIDESKIPRKYINKSQLIAAKASFGFGDVNACVIFSKYSD